MTTASVTVPATPDFVRAAAQFIVQTARHLGVPEASAPLFEVAIGEALANAVKHGSSGRPDANITSEVERTGSGIRIRIYDDGEGFVPTPRYVPALEGEVIDISAVPESGYGVTIIRNVFNDIQTRRENGRFCLELSLDSAPSL